ncbi:hypothetical protein EGR_00444 [Echinococcus granulosus]|uniref:Uncharacterized protein n=1 Tax=Echinococcus granulosus TaxID=6210 RepID=W6VCB3_ECHGR|nr:hypothetical protein EGR_00444 [Echinococcus granulosus]EUB64494.1 hypothetical protein EGR_00444 [Echinococcus granulosus]
MEQVQFSGCKSPRPFFVCFLPSLTPPLPPPLFRPLQFGCLAGQTALTIIDHFDEGSMGFP